MTIKPFTYYKELHADGSGGFYIFYTTDKKVTEIAFKADETEETIQFTDALSTSMCTIKQWQKNVDKWHPNVREITEDELFVELI